MSQKIALAAAVLAVALSQTQATWLSSYQQRLYEERRKQQQQLQSFDEDEWKGEVGVSYGNQSGLGVNIGISHTWEEEQEQKINIGKALKKAANIIVKANELGLLEEAEWDGKFWGELYGGKVGGRQITFDEESEEVEQKFKLGKALKKAANVVVKAHELGLFEEDNNIMEEEQKLKLGKALKKVANVVVKAKELGLFEEEQDNDELQVLPAIVVVVGTEILKDVAISLAVDAAVGGVKQIVKHYSKHEEDEDEEQWNGEISGEYGRQNGQTNWNIKGKVTFDEDEEQHQPFEFDRAKWCQQNPRLCHHYYNRQEKKQTTLDEDEEQFLPIQSPLTYKPVRDFVRDATVNTVRWVRDTFKDEDEEQVYIDPKLSPEDQILSFNEYLKKCERNPMSCMRPRKFDEDELQAGEWTAQDEKRAKWCQQNPRACHHANDMKPTIQKWSHNGFKPKFEKPSSLQFKSNEQF